MMDKFCFRKKEKIDDRNNSSDVRGKSKKVAGSVLAANCKKTSLSADFFSKGQDAISL